MPNPVDPEKPSVSFMESIPWIGEYLAENSALASMVEISFLLLSGILVFIITKGVLRPLLGKIVARTRNQWDDILISPSFLNWISWVPVTAVGNYGATFLVATPDWIVTLIRNVSRSLTLVMILFAIGALLTAINNIYSRRAIAKTRPIKGYLQILKIILYLVGGLAAISLLVDESPWRFLAGIGAMTAVLLLIFKDTILSLVASVTLSSNDMVRVGDWIEMPQAGADGDVIDISLHTVKVQNWDRTISTIPTYRLMSDSYKNWRGMQESGGRRIKRSIRVDLATVRFLSEEEITHFARFRLLSEYITGKRQEIAEWNARFCSNDNLQSNSRRLSNLGTLRAYIINYLRSRSDIHQPGSGLMFLVRQLEADQHGVPIEIYVFTTTTSWVDYEGIQADIFEHIFAIVPEFGLRIFQDPSGHNFQALACREATSLSVGPE